jgi:diguanylate cyclase (GGDEF)-like protein
MALLFLDVDRFKRVNDTRGHAVGDRLLLSVAQRLSACVRASDTVSRQGGDEFVILLPELARAGDAAVTADKILLALGAPHRFDAQELYATVSIGIALYPDDGVDASTLMKHADSAMYQAKAHGRNNYQFFSPAMSLRAAGVPA